MSGRKWCDYLSIEWDRKGSPVSIWWTVSRMLPSGTIIYEIREWRFGAQTKAKAKGAE